MTSKRLPAKRGAEPPDALDRAILGLLAKLPTGLREAFHFIHEMATP